MLSDLKRAVKFGAARLIVPLVVLLLYLFRQRDRVTARFLLLVAVYYVLAFATAFFTARSRKRRYRALCEAVDLMAISLLVAYTGGFASHWSILYVFPLMSAARYLTALETAFLALAGAFLFDALNDLHLGPPDSSPLIVIWTASLVGVAVTASSLARMRDKAEDALVRDFATVDQLILKNADMSEILESIMNAALETTDSDFSAVLLVGNGDQDDNVTVKGKGAAVEVKYKAKATRLVLDELQRVKARTPAAPDERARTISKIGEAAWTDIAIQWQSRFTTVPAAGEPMAILGVFSLGRLHYTENDVRKLQCVGPMIEMALNNAKLYRRLEARNADSKMRLELLYEIGSELRADQELRQLFTNIVRLVSTRLGSEEAALFLPNPAQPRLEKVAVYGPTPEITEGLQGIEQYYEGPDGMTKWVFDNKTPRLLDNIPSEELHSKPYAEILPSKVTRHYMGVPLLIGGEVLGVIRVLNKKSADYSPEPGKAVLAEGGFSEDDLNLLTLIATQVVSAIRNAAFLERNKFFENLVYHSPDPIIVLDEAGRIQHFNHACENIWGLSEDEVRSHKAGQYYESVEVDSQIQQMLRNNSDHTIQDHATNIRDKAGNLIPIRLSATLLFDREGREAGSIGIFKDERENLRRAEEKIRAEKLVALGKLARAAGHEIKQDMGAIQMLADTLKREITDPEERYMLSGIRDAADRAVTKLQRMLLAARPRPLCIMVVSLNAFLTQFEHSVRARVMAAKTSFRLNVPPGDRLIPIDPDQFQEVLRNLLSNSIDAIAIARDSRSATGLIELDVAIENDNAVLLWRDDGCGMGEDLRRKAFTAFSTTKANGSGLGLYLSKTIVESHRGSISLETAPAGTAFRITLPLWPETGDEERAEAKPVTEDAIR